MIRDRDGRESDGSIYARASRADAAGLQADANAALALRKRITTVVRGLVRGDAMIDDVVQELWLWTWRHGVTEPTYIELKHHAWDVLRRERRHEHEELSAARDVAAPRAPDNARCDQLQDVLEQGQGQGSLTRFQEMVLLRRYWFGDNVQEIAIRTGRDTEEVTAAEQTALAMIAQELHRRLCDGQ